MKRQVIVESNESTVNAGDSFRISDFGFRISDFLPLLSLLLALPTLAATGAEGQGEGASRRLIPRPLPQHPGHVFQAGETVKVALPSDKATRWELADYGDRTLTPVRLQAGVADLGQLPVGFYRLRPAGATNAAWISLAVIEPLKAPTPRTSPIALDVAMAWFYGQDQMAPAANLCALAGVNWVRDRLSWPEMERERGQFAGPTRYDNSARAQSAADLRVLQVHHHSPAWANPEGKRFPLDLRDAYHFSREMARRWQGQVAAFEPWNEADIDVFGGHTGADMAALQKASYLGLKAGNPRVIACLNVFALHRTAQLADLHANEAWPYFDTYNLHHYEPYDRYPALYADHRAVSAGRPLWVSECAMPVKWSGDDRVKELADDQLWEQSERLVKTFAASLHEGAAATFYFLLPHYVEGQTQFGILRPDLTPRPAYVSLAAVGRLLADAAPQGRLKADTNIQAYLFRAQPDGQARAVLVAWARNGESTLNLPAKPAAAYDHLGRPLPANLSPKLTKAPVFLLWSRTPKLLIEPPPRPPARLAGKPSPVVFQALFPKDKTVLAKSAAKISTEKPETVAIYAYNFSDQPVRGKLALTGDPRFLARLPETGLPQTVELAPMERKELPLKLDCRQAAMRAVETLKITGDFGAAGRPVLSFNLMPDPLKMEAQTLLRLDAAADLARWDKEISGGGALQIAAADGGVEIIAEPKGNDRWVFPRLDLIAGERPPAGATALAFTLTLQAGGGTFRVIWRETGGACYVSELVAAPKAGETIEAVATFEGAVFGTGWSPADPNGKLDPTALEAVKIGINTKDPSVRYRIKNVRWVTF